MGALGMDAAGIPVPLIPNEAEGMQEAPKAGIEGFLQEMARQSKGGPPLLTLDEETAARMRIEGLDKQPYLIELSPESLAALLRQLNHAQLMHALREGAPVEARHRGERYLLAPAGEPREAGMQDPRIRMGSLKDMASMAGSVQPVEQGTGVRGALTPAAFQGATTNLPGERLPAVTAMEWIARARTARGAFAPVQIVMGRTLSGEGVLTWRNHQNLQFLTHRLRCHLHAEWRAHGESRPVEDVLRDLQEVHRATLTVDGAVVRRLATNPSRAVAGLLTKLNLWELFHSPDAGK